jgi:hypothetical protein
MSTQPIVSGWLVFVFTVLLLGGFTWLLVGKKVDGKAYTWLVLGVLVLAFGTMIVPRVSWIDYGNKMVGLNQMQTNLMATAESVRALAAKIAESSAINLETTPAVAIQFGIPVTKQIEIRDHSLAIAREAGVGSSELSRLRKRFDDRILQELKLIAWTRIDEEFGITTKNTLLESEVKPVLLSDPPNLDKVVATLKKDGMWSDQIQNAIGELEKFLKTGGL